MANKNIQALQPTFLGQCAGDMTFFGGDHEGALLYNSNSEAASVTVTALDSSVPVEVALAPLSWFPVVVKSVQNCPAGVLYAY
ncbi:MAG: hypothetical protein MJZ81_06665 [Bacteroidales bacterium]|nr:hypothetical protein [Bacteroidales bacterium]